MSGTFVHLAEKLPKKIVGKKWKQHGARATLVPSFVTWLIHDGKGYPGFHALEYSMCYERVRKKKGSTARLRWVGHERF